LRQWSWSNHDSRSVAGTSPSPLIPAGSLSRDEPASEPARILSEIGAQRLGNLFHFGVVDDQARAP